MYMFSKQYALSRFWDLNPQGLLLDPLPLHAEHV